MDPQELSAQKLVQLCLESQDEAMCTEFVRRFQPLIAEVVNKCVSFCADTGVHHSSGNSLGRREHHPICWNNFNDLRLDFCNTKVPVLPNQSLGQSNYLEASGIDKPWNL